VEEREFFDLESKGEGKRVTQRGKGGGGQKTKHFTLWSRSCERPLLLSRRGGLRKLIFTRGKSWIPLKESGRKSSVQKKGRAVEEMRQIRVMNQRKKAIDGEGKKKVAEFKPREGGGTLLSAGDAKLQGLDGEHLSEEKAVRGKRREPSRRWEMSDTTATRSFSEEGSSANKNLVDASNTNQRGSWGTRLGGTWGEGQEKRGGRLGGEKEGKELGTLTYGDDIGAQPVSQVTEDCCFGTQAAIA